MWGACYKMEQYPLQGRAFRVMAPAKLLTENERSRQAVNRQIVLTSIGEQLQALLHLPSSILCVYHFARQALRSRAPVPPTRRCNIFLPELNFFSFRPPPVRLAT
jgi:hypothetical protein